MIGKPVREKMGYFEKRRKKMKKKLMVALAAVMAACALTACGNPLKSLPEVGSDNLVDLVDENEDKNQAAAAILKKIKKDELAIGDVEEVTVYDRKDDEDGKEKSDVYVQISSESDMASYTTYYVFTMKYDSDSKDWEVKKYEADEDEDIQVEFTSGMDDEDILDDIINKEYSIYVEDEEGNYYYLYPTTDTVSDFTVSEPAITVDSSEHLLIDYDVTMTITSGMYFYSVEGTVEYSFWIDGGSEDLYYNYGDYTLVSREIDPEIGDALSDEQMITDFDSCEFAIGSDGYVVSSADFVDYNFEDIYFGSDYASRYLYYTLEVLDGVQVEYYAYLYYDYDGSTYSFDKYSCYNYYNYETTYTDDVLGTWSGSMVETYYNDNGKNIASIDLVMDEYSNNQGYIYGTAYFTETESGEVYETDFEAYYSSSGYFYIDLDDYVYIYYDKEKHYTSVSYLYLYPQADGSLSYEDTWYDVTYSLSK